MKVLNIPVKYVICITLIDFQMMRPIAVFFIVVYTLAIPDQASVIFANTFNLPVDVF